MTAPLLHSEASAAVYDLLARGFSYPDQVLYRALTSGSFGADALANIALLGNPAPLHDALEPLLAGLGVLGNTYAWDKLQSEYLELFELNRHQVPLHLNAHLYTPGQTDPAAVHRHLQDTYRAFGLELKPDPRVESPDHLTLQLEFLAYLYRLLGSVLRTGEPDAAGRVRDGISGFLDELAWIHRFVELLQDRSAHPFYVPLAGLLRALLIHAAGDAPRAVEAPVPTAP
jgi:DMSO reductase family type II enzyme chaperone